MSTEPVFFGDWSSVEDMLRDFQCDDLGGHEVVIAGYFYEDYQGSAYVLSELNGELFECEGSQCSCYGLEGQWKPTQVTREYLVQRLAHGRFADGDYLAPANGRIADALRAFLSNSSVS